MADERSGEQELPAPPTPPAAPAAAPAASPSSSLPQDVLIDKIRGIAAGNALGDTIGLYTEFMNSEQAEDAYPKASFRLTNPTTPFHVDRHRARFEERAWTDDTDQMLLILLSYLHNNGTLTPSDFASRLRDWLAMGLRCLDRLPLGIGNTVGMVVTHPDFLADPTGVSKKRWILTKCINAANGAVMRTSIIAPMFINATEDESYRAAVDIALVTHADPRCLVSCVAVVALLRGLMTGELTREEQIDEYLERSWNWVVENALDEVLTDENGEKLDEETYNFNKEEYLAYCGVSAKKLYDDKKEGMIVDDRRMGYTYIALGTGVWCLRRVMLGKDDFKSVITKLTMMGGDADTNGAVAGALVGGYTGYKAIAPEWRDGLRYSDWLLQKVEGMCVLSGVITDKTYNGKEDADTARDGGRGLLTEADMREREKELMKTILLKIEAQRKADAKKPRNLWGLLKP
ncbi:ADP-ribosylarginine hydrolase [Drechslerella dactyloides]|uniref:ADP-ribosylarginine hydrolase n=1 Tax=Drechslerella dactyloides TaxID=74499 RepID=A0AAD6IXP7_DREDA|nr:ADP-ribosylarginine hydrolase [Drechslerella dactyloides]